MSEENKGGRPVVWTPERREILNRLLIKYLNKDQLFENSIYDEVAEVVPLLAHFIAGLYENWDKIREEYPLLADVKRSPSKATILKMDELSYGIAMLKTIQERGLVYGTLSGSLQGNVASLMLQNHGYTNKQELEHSGGIGVTIVDDIK